MIHKPIFSRLFCAALLLISSLRPIHAQDEILGTIPAGNQPVSVAINPATGQAFIVNRGSQEVSIVDLQTRTIVAKYKISGSLQGIAVNPRTNHVVVTSSNGEVSIIDHGQGKVVATIPVGKAPSGVAIDVEKNTALVTDFDGGCMYLIDLAARQIAKKIDLKNGSSGVAVLEGKRLAVVACQYDMELLLIDLDAGRVKDELIVGRYISEVAANQTTGMVAVGNPSSSGILWVYSPEKNAIVSTLPIGAGPLSVAVYAKRNVALVGAYNSAAAILVDLEQNRVIKSIPVARGPSGIAIDPGTGFAVVINSLAETATFIDIERIFNPPVPPPPEPPKDPSYSFCFRGFKIFPAVF